jgi:CRP/FNR family transcriptional regulator, anaerobic regulatory protein
MIPERSCADCAVRGRALCASLDAHALGTLRSIGQRRTLRRGETLQWAGEESLACGNLVRGMVKLSAGLADGREQVVALLHPADFIGAPFAEQARFTATALCDAEWCAFPRGGFERALAACPTLAHALLQRSLAALEAARSRMLTLARTSAGEKVAELLLELAERAGGSRAAPGAPLSFDLPLSRGEMAAVLGLSIETVSRQLHRLKARGAIRLTGARGITIRDTAQLQGTEAPRHA